MQSWLCKGAHSELWEGIRKPTKVVQVHRDSKGEELWLPGKGGMVVATFHISSPASASHCSQLVRSRRIAKQEEGAEESYMALAP